MIDKVRKGMECCVAKVRGATVKDCSIECPYFHEGVFCKNALHGDVKQIIQQLETALDVEKNSKMIAVECNGELQQEIDKLESRLAQVEREKDAAVHDCAMFPCTTCSNEGKAAICYICHGVKGHGRVNYDWRGVCPENTKEE